MAEITTEQVKALRDRTGVSVMDCKRALEEAGGDTEKALVILRKKSAASAEKKADRTLGAGRVAAYIHTNKEIGAMVLLSSETDFVAKTDEFLQLAYDIAMHAAATAPEFISRSQVTEESTKAAREVFEKEASDKPEAMRAKIVEGKMDAYLAERVLLDQPFIKDPTMTISDLIKAATQKFGEKVEVTECVRFSARG
jgi:elongation factor Ts